MTIKDILSQDFEGTVVNQYGEGVYLGKPETVKHNKYDYRCSWKLSKKDHKSPFDTLLIHRGKKILKVVPVDTFRLDGDIRSLTVHMT